MPANVESMFSVRQMPWHQEGTVLDGYPGDWDTARHLAGLDWDPVTSEVYAFTGLDPDGTEHHQPIDGWKTITRSDTGTDFSGLCCILVALACLAHTPWIRSRPGSGVWSLTLVLLAAVAGAYRLVTLTGYLHNPHLITVSLTELLILVVAVALVAPDAARAQTPTPGPPPYPGAMAA